MADDECCRVVIGSFVSLVVGALVARFNDLADLEVLERGSLERGPEDQSASIFRIFLSNLVNSTQIFSALFVGLKNFYN